MQGSKQDRRKERMEKQIQECLASYFLKSLNVAEDGLVSVTRVIVPKDFKSASIYIHQYGKSEGDNQAQQEALIEKLTKKTALFQRHLGQSLKLRYSPKLDFHYDLAFEKTLAVDKIIYDLSVSNSKKQSDENVD